METGAEKDARTHLRPGSLPADEKPLVLCGWFSVLSSFRGRAPGGSFGVLQPFRRTSAASGEVARQLLECSYDSINLFTLGAQFGENPGRVHCFSFCSSADRSSS